MVTVTGFARFNLSALPEAERRAVRTVIATLEKDGGNALNRLHAEKAFGFENTYVIRTSQGTRIIAEVTNSADSLEVVDVYPRPIL